MRSDECRGRSLLPGVSPEAPPFLCSPPAEASYDWMSDKNRGVQGRSLLPGARGCPPKLPPSFVRLRRRQVMTGCQEQDPSPCPEHRTGGQYTSFSVQEDKKGILSEKAMQTGTIRQ